MLMVDSSSPIETWDSYQYRKAFQNSETNWHETMFQILFCFQAKITEIAIGDISPEQFFPSENYVA